MDHIKEKKKIFVSHPHSVTVTMSAEYNIFDHLHEQHIQRTAVLVASTQHCILRPMDQYILHSC